MHKNSQKCSCQQCKIESMTSGHNKQLQLNIEKYTGECVQRFSPHTHFAQN